ncbi:LacI family DNA-binding transcriptional regulator [Glycomyces sp. NPDC021274]|uniref:LacI family DNA-binding transcriptional regulator n=1 Tax=Glycomyces sp. NPDC021274 TaxID=3155120 RepID=UPI0033ED0A3C
MTSEPVLEKPATAADVARLAGVSRSTVSFILNGKLDRFPEETRRRVLDAAERLRYRPSSAGRSLVSGRSDTVIVLLPNTTFGSNLQDAVDRVVEHSATFGGNVVVRFASTTVDATLDAIRALRPLAVVDFGVLSAEDRENVEKTGVIVVSSLRRGGGQPDGGIGEIQADALLRRGPRRLWFASLSDNRIDAYGPHRFKALQRYCEERGLEPPRTVSVPLTVEGGAAALRAVLEAGGPAGIACYNDDVGMALLAGARREGVEVPETVSLVGVDNTPMSALSSPTLSTVDTGIATMVDLLSIQLERRLGRDVDAETEPVHRFTLVERESS